MMISDLLNESYNALVVNKARSILTMLGIIIGIGSVIAMVGIGQGSKASIQASIESIGSNLLSISPGTAGGFSGGLSQGRGSADTLTRADAEAIEEQITLAEAVSPEVSTRTQVTATGTNTNTQVYGVTDAYAVTRSVNMSFGSFISEQNDKSLSKVAVLGPTTRDDLFGEGIDPVGKTIRINQLPFTIIGVTESKGSSGFNNQDDIVFVPLSTAQQYFSGASSLSSISVKASTSESMEQLEAEITSLLLVQHGISDPNQADFSVTNQADILSTASSITGTFTTLLAAIAAISLLVGGIGIMNMMLTTVTERTKEIGLRKAIGALASDINHQFLMEAIMITFSGGVLGVLLGWLLSFGIEKFGNTASDITLSSVALALGVSVTIGIIFGYYPAKRAAQLHPIDALRFE
jgi:putative ABC transport system permease protein